MVSGIGENDIEKGLMVLAELDLAKSRLTRGWEDPLLDNIVRAGHTHF